MSTNNQMQSKFTPEFRIGKIGVFKVYQISEDELTKLEQGARQSLLLVFGVAILSLAVGFIPTLLTTSPSPRIFIVLVVATIGGGLTGLILMILWWCTHLSIHTVATEIRERMPTENEGQPLQSINEPLPSNELSQDPGTLK